MVVIFVVLLAVSCGNLEAKGTFAYRAPMGFGDNICSTHQFVFWLLLWLGLIMNKFALQRATYHPILTGLSVLCWNTSDSKVHSETWQAPSVAAVVMNLA